MPEFERVDAQLRAKLDALDAGSFDCDIREFLRRGVREDPELRAALEEWGLCWEMAAEWNGCRPFRVKDWLAHMGLGDTPQSNHVDF